MRLDRYTGQKPKFQVFRRIDDPAFQPSSSDPDVMEIDEVLYRLMPAFDYFVLALKDRFVPPALQAYAGVARIFDTELAEDVSRLVQEARSRPDSKIPD